MDAELQETVEQLVGAGAQVLDCEKRSVVREEEVLLVNGQPLQLQGSDGAAIRKALLAGHVPPHDLLNTVLVRAGILRSPVRLETSLQVKSSVVTREEVTVARGGRVVDERSRQTQEDNVYNSSTTETWEPAGTLSAAEAVAAVAASTNKAAAGSQQQQQQAAPPPQLSRHGKAQAAPPPPLAHAGSFAADRKCGSPLSSSSSSGFWSPGPGGAPPSRSVSDSSCASGPPSAAPHASVPPPAAPPPACGAAPALADSGDEVDEVDAALSRDLHAVNIQTGGCMRDNLASPPHHAHHYSGDACQAGPSGMQLKRSSSRPCNVPGCTQCGPCGRQQRPHQEHTMVYRENTLVSGALEALIRHAIPTSDYFPEDAYLFAFLLCSRMFAPLSDVLVRVIRAMDRCKDERRSSLLARNVLRFLREWTDSFPYDFREETMMAPYIDITQRLVDLLPKCRREVSELQTDLLAKLNAVETYEEFLNRCGSVRYVESVEELTAAQQEDQEPVATPCYLLQGSRAGVTGVMDMVRTPVKLAHQLTHVELERLSHIGAEEFVLAFMKERGVATDDGAPIKKTRSKEAYEDWFTRLSYLVATEICRHPKKKQRQRVLDFWVQTAHECYNIGNFNSLMAINAGVSLAPVARLKKTWSKVHCVKCFAVLQNLMSMNDNYKSYRTTLAAAVKRSKQQNVAAQVPGAHQPPEASNDNIVVPFFYLLVKDLHFLNVGCADRLPNGHINFEKFWQLAKQVTEFVAWKQAVFPFPKITDVIMYLQTSPLLTDNALALASFECEAPDNGPEKEHYKQLKKT